MKLPLLVSVPHAGLEVPDEAVDLCILTPAEIEKDGDEEAAAIYALRDKVALFETTRVARAIVDLNRARDDFSKDGVIKTHTCFDEPVYRHPPSPDLRESLLALHYDPYHERLTRHAESRVVLAVDCHTMCAVAPPVAPDPGKTRPPVCLGNAHGTCPASWMDAMQSCFAAEFAGPVTVNDPFQGGYITRRHSREMPWIQIEIARGPFATVAEKRAGVFRALTAWCRWAGAMPE